MTPAWLWIVFTIFAAAGQTGRNAMQRELTAKLGAVGATHIRFLFGFPFAILFLAAALVTTHQALPNPPSIFWLWDIGGAISQILGTALLLLAMEERSFVVAVAYTKTEPVFVAIMGFLFLADPLTAPMGAAILIAVAGVALISFHKREGLGNARVAMLSLPGMTPVEGGIPLLYRGDIVGAIGVSGVQSFQDGIVAQAGADSLEHTG